MEGRCLSKSWKLGISAVLALFFTFAIFLGMIYVVVAANPTVLNPGFEDDGITPLSWTFYNTTDATPDFFGFYSTFFAHTGNRSVGIDIMGPEGPGDEGVWYQGAVQPVHGDVDHKLSAWVFVAGASPNSHVRIGVRWYDSLGGNIDETWSLDIDGGISGWVLLSVKGTAPVATDTAEIRLKLWVDDPTAFGEVYFDDVEFIVESSSTAEKGGKSPPDHGWYFDPEADPYNEMLQINITAVGEPVNVTSFTLQAGGTANDAEDVAEVNLILDSNSSGTYNLGEEFLANGTYSSDNGSLTLQDSHIIPKGETHSFIIVYQMTGTSDAGETFMFNVTNIAAHGQTSGNPIIVQGLPISSGVKTTVGSLIVSEGPEIPEDHYWNSTGEPDPYNEMLQLKLEALAEDFNVSSVMLQAAGTGNDTKDITEVNLILDSNGNGQYDNGESFLSNGTYPADDGLLTLSIYGGYVISKWNSVYFLVVYQMAEPIIPGKNFTFNVTAIDATGSIDDSQYVVGLPISSCTKTTKDTTQEVPFWMQWWFWLIVVVGIVALAGAAYFLKKKQ